MSVFSDLFVLQVAGILVNNKFSGIAGFGFDHARAEFRFHQGTVTHVSHAGLTGEAALAEALWQTRGRLMLEPGPQPATAALDYPACVDKLIAETAPPMHACPMMAHLFLNRGPIKPVQASQFTNMGFDILLHIKRGMKLYEAQERMNASEFWKGVLYLSSNGQILPSYDPTVGAFLRARIKDLEAQITKLLGNHMNQAYREKVAEAVRSIWPDWRAEQQSDPIYGTAVYRAWLRALGEEIQHIGAPSLTQRCYNHVLSSLTHEENMLFQRLINL